MAINPEFSHPEATEPQRFYHPELHAPEPEARVSGVQQWYHQVKRLDQHGPEELRAVVDELHDIPEVLEYADEPVNLNSLRSMPELAQTFAETNPSEKFSAALTAYQELYLELAGYIDRYTDTLRRFELVRTQSIREDDREKFKIMTKTVDTARKRAHDALMSHLNAISRMLNGQIPKAASSGFNLIGWQSHLKQYWFSLDQIRDRKYIEEWAVRTDIGEKAAAVEVAIQEVLEKKNADVA